MLDKHDSINIKFEDSGYQYSDFILNLGQIFIVTVALPLLIILFLALKYLCCNEKLREFFRRQLEKTVFNRIIMFFDASLLLIGTSAWVNIYQVNQGAVPQSLSYIVSITYFCLVSLSMLILFAYSLRNFEQLEDE